tara:strand:- start:83 stop:223 length:141 start_codon:yes stop_codon:yes gene_type:complete
MLSIKKCNEVLNKNKKKYSKKEVKKIREYLYQMVIIIDELKPKYNE